MMVFGISDPWIWGVYVLIILSTLLCVAYGIVNWNKGDEDEEERLQDKGITEEDLDSY